MKFATHRTQRAPSEGKAATSPKRAMHSEAALQVLGKLRQALRVARSHSGRRQMRARVTSSQIWVLCELEAHPGIKVTDLARAMALHQSTISNLIEKLVQKQLIRRKADRVDARVSHLYVTAAGKRVVSRTAPVPHNSLLDTLEHLSPQSLRLLDRQLTTLLRRMEP